VAMQLNLQYQSGFFFSNTGGSTNFGDVNISAILNSFQMGYDKRVRPNYGGKFSFKATYLSLYSFGQLVASFQ